MGDKPLESQEKIPDSLDTLEAFWQFWDTHSSADYEDIMEPVELEVELFSDRVYCAIAKDVIIQVRRQARRQGVSTETLVNLWLQERLAQAA